MTSQNLVTARALDCSQIADWSRAIGWDVDYQQIGCGAFDADFAVVGCGQLRITQQVCNRDVAIQGVPPQGMLAVVLPMISNSLGVFQGVQLKEHEGIILRPEVDGFLRSPRNVWISSVSISRAQLESALWDYNRSELSTIIPTSSTFAFSPQVIRKLNDSIIALQSTGIAKAGILEIEDQMLRTIAEGLCGRAGEVRERNRVKYVRQARDYIEAHLGRVVRLSDVATNAGVSSRTLGLAFREVLGVTPVEYIRTRRLNRARQLLLSSAHVSNPITHTAIQCGLPHLGYFSRDYMKLFGELPSQTLKRV
ncbi:Exoenzyme S synthesis regulatory protein ExsA [Planctomycetes bacterium CA13]|uniref:Exoenzyme S synthesis regulatory protein ExsA n=1 Tax=Novipirellula herctigrandis TaxID=2527986 RepID=A0A5C5ZAE1_9BACT|nr:Exoenzyme S synthesis regulatory protein ExsA [Planctomycetes bacterium CA13]